MPTNRPPTARVQAASTRRIKAWDTSNKPSPTRLPMKCESSTTRKGRKCDSSRSRSVTAGVAPENSSTAPAMNVKAASTLGAREIVSVPNALPQRRTTWRRWYDSSTSSTMSASMSGMM
jgi:hypothetical protein